MTEDTEAFEAFFSNRLLGLITDCKSHADSMGVSRADALAIVVKHLSAATGSGITELSKSVAGDTMLALTETILTNILRRNT